MVDWNATVYLEIDTVGLFPTPSAINELDNNQKSNINGIFDILGKEWKTNFADLPKGVYIVNGRKVLKPNNKNIMSYKKKTE